MTPAQRAYIKQMLFVLESYGGRQPETANLSQHLYNFIHGFEHYPQAIQYAPVMKKISPVPQADNK